MTFVFCFVVVENGSEIITKWNNLNATISYIINKTCTLNAKLFYFYFIFRKDWQRKRALILLDSPQHQCLRCFTIAHRECYDERRHSNMILHLSQANLKLCIFNSCFVTDHKTCGLKTLKHTQNHNAFQIIASDAIYFFYHPIFCSNYSNARNFQN